MTEVYIYFLVSVGQWPVPWLSLPWPSSQQGRPGEICVIGPKGQKVSYSPGVGAAVGLRWGPLS